MKKRTFSHTEHCVFSCFVVVCNDAYSVYIFAGFEQLFWCESLSFEERRCGFVYVALEKCVVFGKMEDSLVKCVTVTVFPNC